MHDFLLSLAKYIPWSIFPSERNCSESNVLFPYYISVSCIYWTFTLLCSCHSVATSVFMVAVVAKVFAKAEQDLVIIWLTHYYACMYTQGNFSLRLLTVSQPKLCFARRLLCSQCNEFGKDLAKAGAIIPQFNSPPHSPCLWRKLCLLVSLLVNISFDGNIQKRCVCIMSKANLMSWKFSEH